MAIALFDIENGKVTATPHCFTIEVFKKIIDKYPKDYPTIFVFFHYMSSLNEEDNPFANIPELEKEELVLSQIGAKFSLDDELIVDGLELSRKLYETTTYYTFLSIKMGLEKLGKYMREMVVRDGSKDGNVGDIIKTAKEYDGICKSFEARYKAFKEEAATKTRGGQDLGYDQQK